ncbi:MAG: multiple sugar transport system permease protein [Candidatus Atribacteria bacterium]|nr:multiple sugar transport system permease protein [Candidatus Atribacteria bacterium]MDI3530800.1 multiple sugar transport system permease protein [Candidatus Atribacteria bacterium]
MFAILGEQSNSALPNNPVVGCLKVLFSKRKEMIAAYMFLLPSFLVIGVFVIYPIVSSFLLSFQDWNLLGNKVWAGFDNYQRLSGDPIFKDALRNTAYFSFGSIPGKVIIALFIAVLLNKGVFGLKAFRTIYFLPVVCSSVAAALMWQWLYDTNFGFLNFLLRKIGLGPVPWITSEKWAMPSVIAVSVWKDVGYNMVILLAALQDVPAEIYEAAKIDGAGRWAVFRYITLPLISPAVLFVTIMSVIFSFQVFDVTTILTGGGPGTATISLVQYIYKCAFQFFRMGYASAVAYVLFLIVLGFTILQMRFARRWVHY